MLIFASAAWAAPPLEDPSTFPIAVWLQQAYNADRYKEVGVNLFVGQWEGPTEDQLGELTAAGMPVLADQNDVGLAHLDDPILWGWTQQDEPDNAQPDGNGGYGACVDPQVIVDRYQAMKAADPSRPVMLNLGQNVAWPLDDPWYGRGGDCADQWDQYPVYVEGADIVSFDIYPVTSTDPVITGNLWYVAQGIDRLVEWTGGTKPVWAVIEASQVGSDVLPTPSQIETEVWMALVHGASGIMYFCHQFSPTFSETQCLDEPTLNAGLTAINARIAGLAPVLGNVPLTTGWTVASSDPAVPIDARAIPSGADLYLFAVAMRDGAATGTFTVDGVPDGEVEVLDEGRTVPIVGGVFADPFDGYAVHLYRMANAAGTTATTTPTEGSDPTVPGPVDEVPGADDPDPPSMPSGCGCDAGGGSAGGLLFVVALFRRRIWRIPPGRVVDPTRHR